MLDDATSLLAAGRNGSAVDRAYYAMVHSCHAALAGVVSQQPKSHRGLRTMLSDRLLKPGRVELGYGDDFTHAFDLRQKCTYDPSFAVAEADARGTVVAATGFVERVRRLLEGRL